jgi:mediator of RNA polymerase II transcription subunit 14
MSNSTQLAEKREQAQPMSMSVVGHHLRRFIDFFVQQHTECSFYPALRDLAANFTLPNEGQPTLLQQNQVIMCLQI